MTDVYCTFSDCSCADDYKFIAHIFNSKTAKHSNNIIHIANRIVVNVYRAFSIIVPGFVQTLESPEIKMLRFPGLEVESPGKRHRY